MTGSSVHRFPIIWTPGNVSVTLHSVSDVPQACVQVVLFQWTTGKCFATTMFAYEGGVSYYLWSWQVSY